MQRPSVPSLCVAAWIRDKVRGSGTHPVLPTGPVLLHKASMHAVTSTAASSNKSTPLQHAWLPGMQLRVARRHAAARQALPLWEAMWEEGSFHPIVPAGPLLRAEKEQARVRMLA